MNAIFLDRDGTINVEPADGIVDTIDKVKIFVSVFPALQLLSKNNYALFFITNQHGINLGRISEAQFHKINNYILEKLQNHGINIKDTFYCPHLDSDHCNCKKPRSGLIKQARRKYDINLSNSYIIGDRETDMILGKKVGCRTIFVRTGNNKSLDEITPDCTVENLLEAAKYSLIAISGC